jgi:RNA-directed DNA polymerase
MSRSGKMFVSFIPAVSAKAAKAMKSVLRQWKFSHRGDLALEELVRWLQPIVRGWVNYYGRFNPSALYRALRMVDELVVRWARRKYKKFKKRSMGAWDWLKRLKSKQPTLLPHWQLGTTVGR